jgi:hypothetical protein
MEQLILLYIVFTFLLIFQVIIALTSILSLRKRNDYSYVLGSQMKVVDFLEKYARIIKSINISILNISQPDIYKDTIVLSREHLDSQRMLAHFKIFEILMIFENKYQTKFGNDTTVFLFLAQLITLVVALYTTPGFIFFSLLFQIVLLIISYYNYNSYQEALIKEVFMLTDLLELDELETARFEKLISINANKFFIYPLKPITSILGFLGITK